MAVTVLSATDTQTFTGTNSLGVTLPATMADGCSCYILIARGFSGEFTPPAGWAHYDAAVRPTAWRETDGPTYRVSVIYKHGCAASDAGTTVTIAAVSTWDWWACAVATTASEILRHATFLEFNPSTFTHDIPSRTVDTVGELNILAGWASETNATQSVPAGSTRINGSGESKLLVATIAGDVLDVISGDFQFGTGTPAVSQRFTTDTITLGPARTYTGGVQWIAGTSGYEVFNATELTANAPAGLENGGNLIAIHQGPYGSSITPPAGWTLVAALDFTPVDDWLPLAIFKKDAVTTADSSQPFTWTHEGDGGRWGITYAATTDGEIQTPAASESAITNSAIFTYPQQTATEDDELWLLIGLNGYSSNQLATSSRVPAGATKWTKAVPSLDDDLYYLQAGYRYRKTGDSSTDWFHSGATSLDVSLGVVLRITPPSNAQELIISASSPLGSPLVLLYNDFSGDPALATALSDYVMDLTTPSGTVRVPISSWQATRQVGQANYAQCVVPACLPYVDAINDATVFTIRRRARNRVSGVLLFEQIMAQAPVQAAQFARGSFNYTCTISGYTDPLPALPENPKLERTLSGVQTIYQTVGGGARVRASIDWLLQPGQRANIPGGGSVLASYINYFIGGGQTFMDVGERPAVED